MNNNIDKMNCFICKRKFDIFKLNITIIIIILLFSGCSNHIYTTNDVNSKFECNIYCLNFNNKYSCDFSDTYYKETIFNKKIINKTCSCAFYNCLFNVSKK